MLMLLWFELQLMLLLMMKLLSLLCLTACSTWVGSQHQPYDRASINWWLLFNSSNNNDKKMVIEGECAKKKKSNTTASLVMAWKIAAYCCLWRLSKLFWFDGFRWCFCRSCCYWCSYYYYTAADGNNNNSDRHIEGDITEATTTHSIKPGLLYWPPVQL